MAGMKHVISASVDQDNLKGTCIGTGQIRVRLNPNETLDQIELNFAKQGVIMKSTKLDSRKKPNMTGPPKEFANEITNTKDQKQKFLQSTNNGVFGGAGSYQV